MKRILIGTCAALACAVSLAAQTPAPPTPQDPAKPAPPSASSASAEKSVTLKGCLRAGDTPDSFVLANASTPTETAGTTGTPAGAPPAAAMKNQTVRLIGAPAGISLKEHVGHTIEVTGMITPQGARPSAGATPPAGATPTPGAAATGSADARLNVKNVKHVDAKCGE